MWGYGTERTVSDGKYKKMAGVFSVRWHVFWKRWMLIRSSNTEPHLGQARHDVPEPSGFGKRRALRADDHDLFG